MLTKAIHKFSGYVDSFVEGNERKQDAYVKFFEENETLGFEIAEKNLMETLERIAAEEVKPAEI